MVLPKELIDDITLYCKANNIADVNDYLVRIIKSAQTIEKYGATPTAKEKIVEKIVEVQIEKIVEKIIEVPVVMVDTEISDKLKEHIILVIKLREDLVNETNISEGLRKELEEEKKKNNGKRDIYGER